jgi:hypothetical protein
MAAKHAIEVEILAQTKKAASALKKFGEESGLNSLASGFAKTGRAIAVGVGAAAGAAGVYLYDAIGKAGDLEQSIGAVDTVFKNNAAQVHQWAQGAAQNLGLTEDAYNQFATVLGTQLKNGGTALDQIGGKTNDLMTLGADLSSMFGGTTADAVGALSSALKGERDPIERYGVSLNQAKIDAKAAALGFTKVGGSFDGQAQQAATLALIMEQTADAHGNFAREADTVQGKQARLSATWDNLSARIGTAFLPAVAAVADVVATRVMPVLERWGAQLAANVGPALQRLGQFATTTVLPALSKLSAWITTNVVPVLASIGTTLTTQVWPALTDFASWVQGASGWLLPLGAAIGSIVAGWKAWTTATKAWKTITIVASAVQAAFNAVISANPIGLIILAIVGLVAGLITLYHTNETARRVIDQAWNAIKGAVQTVGRIIGNVWRGAGQAISNFVGGARSALNSAGNAVQSFGRGVSDHVSSVIRFFRDLPGKISSALSGIGGRMAGIGRNMITSLANALSPRAIVDKIRDVIGDAIGFAKRLLGIASPSRVFTEIGEYTGQGLEVGLARMSGRVRDAAGNLAATVVDAGTPDTLGLPTIRRTRAGVAAAGGGITISVSTLTDGPDVARRVLGVIRDLQRSGQL